MTARKGPQVAHLLDGNVLVALTNRDHLHHEAARRWFASSERPFATCPITQGMLMRLLMQLGGLATDVVVSTLAQLVAHPRHRFWPDGLSYVDVPWRGVVGHRQVTDAYLAALARHHRAKLVTFDRGFAALHPDVAISLADG